jgi:hypothetical protein
VSGDNWTFEDEEKLQSLLERSGRRVAAAYNPANEYEAKELEDLASAVGLLTGVWTQQGVDPKKKEADRFPAKRYLEGEPEKRARQAIGRLLRNSKTLDSALRFHLAELFDELGPHLSFDAAPMERRLVFVGKSQGPTDVTLRNLHMVSDYYVELAKIKVDDRGRRKKARQIICKKYNISDTVLKDARREFHLKHPRLKSSGGQ